MTATAHTTAPSTTTATEVLLPGVVEPSGFVLRDRSIEGPRRGEALVAVEATGISFAEQQMRRGTYFDQPGFPFVPGYDVVGRVTAVGAGVDGRLVGARVAAMTKTGGWTTALVVPAADLVEVPDGIDPTEAEAVLLNGVTAWQLLHRKAQVEAGQVILVHGANGGVGTILVQLARQAGVRVIGTASARHAAAVAALGAEPVDRDDPDLAAAVRRLAPEGVHAVFDHVGGPGLVASWGLVRPGGTLVSYGSASTRDVTGGSRRRVLALVARLAWWDLLPNRRNATFYNVWAGSRRHPAAFRTRFRDDLTAVFDRLAAGAVTAQVAACYPLERAGEAMALAESRTVVGKVVLVPSPAVAS